MRGNNVKRKIIVVSLTSLALVALAYSIANFWIGKAVEETIQKKIEWIKSQPHITVKSHTYKRGWFSSEAITVVDLKPELYVFSILGQPGEMAFTYKQHIKHGPFPLLTSFNLLPYKAAVAVDLVFPAKIDGFLKRVFGKTKPIQITERIAFSDDTKSKMVIASLDHDEAISGIKIKWSGFDSTIEYSGDLKSRISLEGQSEKLLLEMPNERLDLNHFTIKSDKSLGKTGLMVGSDALAIDTLNAQLIGKMPLQLTLNKLAAAYTLNEAGEYIDAESKLDVTSFLLDQKSYGPVRASIEAKHLYAPALLGLGNLINQLQSKASTEKDASNQLFLAYQENGIALLSHNPQISLREFFLRTPDGDVKIQANVALNGFVKTDLDNLFSLWHKIDAQADMVIPRTVLETLLTLQVQHLLVGGSNVEINPDTKAFIRQMVEAQINQWIQEQYIRIDGNTVVSHLSLQKGKLVLNDKPIVLNK